MRIAIVNDLPIAVEVLRRSLALRPRHQISWTARTGGEAVEFCLRDTPDLILMDVVMPEMSGRSLRDVMISARPGIKCLFMSGYTSDIVADNGILDKDIHFLQKPFSEKELSVKLREALG